MKKYKLIALLFIFSGIVSAFDYDFDGIGIGHDSGICPYSSTPPANYNCNGGGILYLQTEYPGLVNITDHFARSAYGSYTWSYNLQALNGTSWISCAHVAIGEGETTISTACWSNQGIYKTFMDCGSCGSLAYVYMTHYVATSGVTYMGSPDYSLHSYVAGSSYEFPVVNKFYPQKTLIAFTDTDTWGSPVDASNATGIYYSTFQSSCYVPSDIYEASVYNMGPGVTYQIYKTSINMSAIQDLNFTAYSHAPGSTLSVSSGEIKNFSISHNQPAAVNYVVWYLNGGIVKIGAANDTTYSFNQSGTGTYLLEVQLEDNHCSRYPTASWTIVVGQTVSISGTVYGRSTSGIVSALPDASVMISCDATSYLNGTTSNLTGGYSFTGLPAGTYTISVGKDFYTAQSETMTFSASSGAVTPYRKDFTLQREEVWGDWYVQVLDSTTNRPITGYNYSLYWGGLLVLQIQNNAVTYKRYANTFNASGDIAGSGEVYVTGIPTGGTYTVKVSKTGYLSPGSSATSVSVTNNITEMSPSWADDIFLRPSSTSSSNQSTVLVFSPNWRNVTNEEFRYVGVTYYSAGVPITGASCSYASTAINPGSGILEDDGTGYYSRMVQVSGSGTSTYNVTCSKQGYDSRSATDTFFIHTGGDIYAEIEWLAYSTPVTAGTLGTYRVWYGNQQGMVTDANCVLKVNGTEYTMSEIRADEGYGRSVLFTSAGSYQVNASCSKSGYMNATSETRDIWVSAAAPPTTIPNHCADTVKNYDETDVDCGGSCSKCAENRKCKSSADCASKYCASGICRSPSCTDDIKNGDENGIDCGGSCYPCACFKNSDCSPSGSEHCQAYSCVRDNCTTTCSSIVWSTYTNPFYDRERYCVEGVCSFTVPVGTNISGNITTTELAIEIATIGSYYVWNNSGITFYVSNCEDATNGFTVSSSKPTQKSYFHVDPSVSPYVTASTTAQTFSAQYTLTYSGLIPKLCEIPVGSKNVSSLIVFYLNDGTSGFKTRSVYAITFRDRFKVNASFVSGSGLVINMTRPGTCKYRVLSTDAWTEINADPDTVVSLSNASGGYKYSIYCNSSYGESASMSIGKGSFGYIFVVAVTKAGLQFIDDFVYSLTGGLFSDLWKTEYTILIIAGLCGFFPALAAFLIFVIMRKKKPDAHKGQA
jgi:hypothetical protein